MKDEAPMTKDKPDFVSPYLRRPLRSLAQAYTEREYWLRIKAMVEQRNLEHKP